MTTCYLIIKPAEVKGHFCNVPIPYRFRDCGRMAQWSVTYVPTSPLPYPAPKLDYLACEVCYRKVQEAIQDGPVELPKEASQ